MRLLLVVAFMGFSSVASAREAAEDPIAPPSKVLSAAERHPFEFRQLAELTPSQSLRSWGEYKPSEEGWAYGIGAEGMLRLGSLVYVGLGISVSALHGESTDMSEEPSEPPEISGWLWQMPLVLELGFPNVASGRFSVGVEAGIVSATVKNMRYRIEDPGGTFNYDGLFLGLRLGYVHWLSDRIGVVLNSGVRLSAGEGTYIYGSLGVRLGVSWRL